MNLLARKEHLHNAIQEAGQATQTLQGGLLVRWVVVGEFALPDGSNASVSMSGTPDGGALRTWEVSGLLFDKLFGSPGRPNG